MLNLGGRRVQIGGFHDHWLRNGTDNPALLMAAMSWYHYDFMCLMDGEDTVCRAFAGQIERWLPGVRIHPGYERTFGFGHVVTVACTAPRIPSDRTDVGGVLRELKDQSGFTALAHPDFPVTGELVLRSGLQHQLLDDDCMDAVEVTPDPELLAFIAERNAAGKRIPVVAGWDIHEVLGRSDLPGVLYDRNLPPIGHIDTAGHDRTIVISEDNSLPALRAAVRAGWSAVELVHQRRLVGPAQAVGFLERNGYFAEIHRLDRERDRIALELPDGHGRVGRPLRLRAPGAAEITTVGSLDRPETRRAAGDGSVDLPALAPILDRDLTHLPVVVQMPDGGRRAFAVRLDHAVGCDLVPILGPDGPSVQIRHRLPFRGRVRATVGGADAGELAMDRPTARLALPAPVAGTGAVPYAVEAVDEHGVARTSTGTLTFLAAPRFAGGWDAIPPAAIDHAGLCGGYGSNRPYPGRDVYAGDWRFAWDDEALLMRVRLTDRHHFNPFRGHYMYQADSLQFGIDPMLRRGQDMGSAYVYNFCLGPDGPELFRWRSAVTEATPSRPALEENVSLGGGHLRVEPWCDGHDFHLRLPWALLAPAAPRAGMSMGLFLHLFNNDGAGLLDAMQWPVAITGMWTIPRLWGQLTLVDAVPAWLADGRGNPAETPAAARSAG